MDSPIALLDTGYGSRPSRRWDYGADDWTLWTLDGTHVASSRWSRCGLEGSLKVCSHHLLTSPYFTLPRLPTTSMMNILLELSDYNEDTLNITIRKQTEMKPVLLTLHSVECLDIKLTCFEE